MAKENKTKETGASVASHLDAIADESRRKDCKAIAKMMKKVTGYDPKMWGSSIVGFGSVHYKYDSGHEGDTCLAGFASRKGDITLYLGAETLAEKKLMEKLGKHKAAGGCLYIKRLEDVDVAILEKLIATTAARK